MIGNRIAVRAREMVKQRYMRRNVVALRRKMRAPQGVEPRERPLVHAQRDDERLRHAAPLLRDKGEAIDIDETAIGDLEMRDHRQGQESNLQERLGEGRAEGARRRA